MAKAKRKDRQAGVGDSKDKPHPQRASRYMLTMDENQLRILNRALDLYARLGAGQMEVILDELPENKGHPPEIEDALFALKKQILGMGPGNYGINSTKIHDCYRVAFDLYRVIAHQLWLDNGQPHGSLNVASDLPRTLVPDQPLAEISRLN